MHPFTSCKEDVNGWGALLEWIWGSQSRLTNQSVLGRALRQTCGGEMWHLEITQCNGISQVVNVAFKWVLCSPLTCQTLIGPDSEGRRRSVCCPLPPAQALFCTCTSVQIVLLAQLTGGHKDLWISLRLLEPTEKSAKSWVQVIAEQGMLALMHPFVHIVQAWGAHTFTPFFWLVLMSWQ